MNTLIGLLIIAIGSFGQSSSYVPINKVKNWSWESFWLVQGNLCVACFSVVGGIACYSGRKFTVRTLGEQVVLCLQ